MSRNSCNTKTSWVKYFGDWGKQHMRVRQLKGYAQAYSRDTSPRMQFFAFTLAHRGLELAMFHFADHTTELVPILPVEGGAGWYSVCDLFVHKTMCELMEEVQMDVCGLQWAYE
ncbi:hypothetical protein B0H10DRAFT_1943091 [Mycena sp. CBHHK59/15]|nr:hypothetical protein B0H10DRAFT_1943091 [Mycena sp. CBHHK59/15]